MEAQVPVLPINVLPIITEGWRVIHVGSSPISVEPHNTSFFDYSKLFELFFHRFFLFRPILVKNLPSNPLYGYFTQLNVEVHPFLNELTRGATRVGWTGLNDCPSSTVKTKSPKNRREIFNFNKTKKRKRINV